METKIVQLKKPTVVQFTSNGVDFRAFLHNETQWMLCYDGFKHGSNVCNKIADNLTSLDEVFLVAETVKSATESDYWNNSESEKENKLWKK